MSIVGSSPARGVSHAPHSRELCSTVSIVGSSPARGLNEKVSWKRKEKCYYISCHGLIAQSAERLALKPVSVTGSIPVEFVSSLRAVGVFLHGRVAQLIERQVITWRSKARCLPRPYTKTVSYGRVAQLVEQAALASLMEVRLLLRPSSITKEIQ